MVLDVGEEEGLRRTGSVRNAISNGCYLPFKQVEEALATILHNSRNHKIGHQANIPSNLDSDRKITKSLCKYNTSCWYVSSTFNIWT